MLHKHINQFINSYKTTALWSSTDDNEQPLDNGDYDLASETSQTMVNDCMKFLEIAHSEIVSNRENFPSAKQMWTYAGHDFWLTRCGHGAGFWDSPELWEDVQLTEICETFGNVDLYIGDDGLIYSM